MIPPPPEPVSVFVAIPADDGHKLRFWQSLLELATSPAPKGVTYRLIPTPGDSLIPRARNNLVWSWYTQTNDDYLLFLDTDLDFRPEDVHRLIQHRLPIVCGLYGKKQEKLGWVVNAIRGEPFAVDGKLHRVACAGTGAFLVHRTVVAAMIAAADTWTHWRVRYYDDNDGSMRWHLFAHAVIDDPVEFARSPRDMSEDWSFCYFARKLGFDVWLDTAAVFLHEGAALYPLQTRRLSREEVEAGEIRQPDGTATPIAPANAES